MKISPVSSAVPVDTQVARAQAVRALRMNTNATPGRISEPAPAAPEPAEPAQELTISDPNDPAEPTVEATQPLSPQLAALAKQRRALQAKERELADRERALTERQPTQGNAVDLARLKSEPLSVLLEAGVTYEQLTEAVMANMNGASPEVQALKAELAALKEGVDKKLADKDTAAEQAVLAEMRKDAERLSKEGDAYELIRETNGVSTVMTLIERTYRETGEVLDVREAMELVETELVNEGLRLAGMGKVKGRLQPEPAPTPQIPPQQRPRTLTNRDTAAVPMDRKQRALLAFTGQLKK